MVRCRVLHLRLAVCIYLFTVIPHLSGLRSKAYEARHRLVEELTGNASITKEILPVVDSSAPVKLRIGMTIQKIATVDEVNQVIRLIVWLRLYWNNPFLTWKPEQYHNISSINLSNELLWIPDISLYNKGSLEEEIDILYKRMTTAVIVEYDGNCTWKAPATLLSQCKIDVSNFPFDIQKCNVTFGSWTYHGNEIDVYPLEKQARSKHYVPNGEWDLLETRLSRKQEVYAGIVYPDVTLNLRIQRRPLYFGMNLIIPCAVIATLAFLSFVLPSNNGERVSLVITVLLAMSVYMLIVSSILPQTSDAMPIVGIYFLCVIIEIALCLFATCFVTRLREIDSEIPGWMDNFINGKLAWFLLMKSTASDYEVAWKTEAHERQVKVVSVDSGNVEVQLAENIPKMTREAHCLKKIDSITSELSVLTDDVIIRQKREMRLRKWQRVASVLDRLFLLLFTTVFVILTSAIFA